jgi:hypothetical protein
MSYLNSSLGLAPWKRVLSWLFLKFLHDAVQDGQEMKALKILVVDLDVIMSEHYKFIVQDISGEATSI